MSIAKVGLYNQQELEAAGHWEEVKDTIVGTWCTFKDLTLSPESSEALSKDRIERDLEPLTLNEIDKILDEYAKEKGYANDQPLTLSAFYLVIGILANRFAIEKESPFYDFLPQGPATNALKLITANIIAGRKQISKKGVRITSRDRFPSTKIFEYRSDRAEYTFSISNERYNNIAKTSNRQGANIRKIFNFLVIKANEQNFNDVVEFDLQELVDRGIYSSKDTAYRGAINCIDNLMGFEIEGTEKRGKEEIRNLKSYIFTGRDIKYKTCTVYTMPGVIEKLCLYYSCLPRWAYSLKSKPYILLDYIYCIANQTRNRKNILKQGYFNIGLKIINTEVGQPEPNDTEHHKQRIIAPILKAIEEIKKHSLNDLKITPIFDRDYKHAHDFLRGHLKIELDRKTHKYLADKAEAHNKKIKQKQLAAAKKGDKKK